MSKSKPGNLPDYYQRLRARQPKPLSATETRNFWDTEREETEFAKGSLSKLTRNAKGKERISRKNLLG